MKSLQPLRPARLARLSLAALAVAGLAGCASTSAPVVFPSQKAALQERAASDMQACRAEADAAVGANGHSARDTGTRVARRGAVEFVDKAVESLVNGSRTVWDRARGAGAGAMAGSITAVALNWNEPDAVYRKYVDTCLKQRGHKVLGWR
ncbi:hypothetical protein [Ralstonia sp.]|uniref:hypothetical protein n=1 Tax=Ralstonia sp. TaxID=54061 RepID=UPI00257D1BEE|nr:hypothetical protein [Ralstonia sp.]